MSEQIVLRSGGSSGQVSEVNSTRIKINLNIEYGDCTFELIDGRYVVHIEGNLKPLTTAVCKYSRDLPQLLAKGGSVMAVCYGLYKLGYSAWNFSPGSPEFELEVDEAQLETMRRQLTKGRFADLLQDEVEVITQKYHLKKFKILSAKEVSMKETDKQSGSSFEAENVNVDHGVVLASNVIIGFGGATNFNPPQKSHQPQPLPQNVTMKDVPVTHGAVAASNVGASNVRLRIDVSPPTQTALPNDGSSGQVNEANSNRIRINLKIEYGESRFELNDQGEYVVHIEGKLMQLTTAVCKYLQYLPQLLAKGGSVMAVCYGLYKLGYSAGNFSPGSLEFELEVGEAQLETIRRQLIKGRFTDLLQDEVEVITQKYHLKKFKIVSAKEVPMKETDKQSCSVFKNRNVDHAAVMASDGIIGEGAAAFNLP